MLRISESFHPIDEELDFEKQGGGDSYRFWITGTKPEMEFLFTKFIMPMKAQYGNFWFDKQYNQNKATDAAGNKFTAPPLKPIKKSDGSWAYFFWKTKNPAFIESQLDAIQRFLRDANVAMAKSAHPDNPEVEKNTNPKLEAFLTKIEQVRDYIEKTVLPTISIPETKEKIETQMEKFVNELAEAVSDADLLEKVNAYLAFASVFHYSFFNTFLIYIQNPKAREVLSVGDWRKLNMQPKSPEELMAKYPGVGRIGLWVPVTSSRGEDAQISAERQWRKEHLPPKQHMPDNPSSADIWNGKSTTKTGLELFQKTAMEKYVRIASSRMKGSFNMKVRFTHLDAGDVVQIPDTPVATRPSQPSWHTAEPDEKADQIYEVLVSVIQRLGLNFQEKEEMRGNSKGSSSMTGDISLLASNAGIGRASTAAHELAHSLTHQTFLSDSIKAELTAKLNRIADKEKRGINLAPEDRLTTKEIVIRDAYWGRGESGIFGFGGDNRILELQAEGSAFVVLRYFGIPTEKLQHSAAYISLWRNDNNAVKANLEIISTTAKGIIALMNEEMGTGNNYEKAKQMGAEPTESLEEDESLSFLYEMSIIGIHKAIAEIKEIKSNLLS